MKITGTKKIATNRKAFHEYHILERMECGIVLAGTEVKSVKAGAVGFSGSFATVEENELILQNFSIQPYEFANRFNHDPLKPRKLLAHRNEIKRLAAYTAQKGITLIPLSVYLKNGIVKIELGLCKGKKQEDKREDLKRKTAERETARAMSAKWRK